MKRTIGIVLLVTGVLFSSNVVAQQQDGLRFSGDVRTGVAVVGGTGVSQEAKLANYDTEEPGFGSPGSIRVNFHYIRGAYQFKWRLEADTPYTGGDYYDRGKGTQHKLGGFAPGVGDIVRYAYAMGDFFDNQLRLSGGKFDAFSDAAWSTNGDEIWQSIESYNSGIRTEYKPKFVPGLNVGFFLPLVYGGAPGATGLPADGFPDLANYLAEIGYGVTYANDNFEVSVSAYFDGNGDGEYDPDKPVGLDLGTQSVNGEKGGNLLWRVNPKIINNLVPALSIWANGYVAGLPIGVDEDDLSPANKGRSETYLYTAAKAGNFNATLVTGLFTFNTHVDEINMGFPMKIWLQRNSADLLLKLKPSYNLTSLITASAEASVKFAFGYDDDYINSIPEDPKTLSSLVLEPKIAFSLPGAILYNGITLAGVTITPVYHFERNFAYAGGNDTDENKDLHRFEIRFMWAF
jgi:hypothetical protein